MTRSRSALYAALLALLALAAGCQAPSGPGADATPTPSTAAGSPGASPGDMDAGQDDYGDPGY
jgi:hypothetical protein